MFICVDEEESGDLPTVTGENILEVGRIFTCVLILYSRIRFSPSARHQRLTDIWSILLEESITRVLGIKIGAGTCSLVLEAASPQVSSLHQHSSRCLSLQAAAAGRRSGASSTLTRPSPRFVGCSGRLGWWWRRARVGALEAVERPAGSKRWLLGTGPTPRGGAGTASVRRRAAGGEERRRRHCRWRNS